MKNGKFDEAAIEAFRNHLQQRWLADSSRKTVNSIIKQWFTFCGLRRLLPMEDLALSDDNLSRYIAWLASKHLQYRVIKNYISMGPS